MSQHSHGQLTAQMVYFTPAFVAAFAACCTIANALSADTVLHKDAYVYGLDPDWTVAYDRNMTELGRYYTPGNLAGISGTDAAPAARAELLGAKCTALSVEDLKRLGGWPWIANDIVRLWGGTSYNLWTTWDGVTNAQTCVGDSIISLVPTGNKQCTINNITTSGVIVNATGYASLKLTSGLTATAGETVTRASTISAGFTAGITVGVPDVVSAKAEYTVGVSFTNTYGSSFDTTVKNEIEKTVTINAEPGKTCVLELTDQSCYQNSRGTVPFTADGWFRIGFNNRVNGHYYYSYGISVLSVDQRSSYAEFTGSINAYSKGTYKGICY
ncbi:hypothetical protein DFH06DRAFT_1318094 [Mycena polygramma]|nr:hypothetical protein DFH06DRAFT_1318094 [Mycena polygramma]